MATKHEPETRKEWVHLTDEAVHVFDQTNGLSNDESEASTSAGKPVPSIASTAAMLRVGQSLNGGGV